MNESVAEFTAVGDDVRFGLRSVRNVGENVIAAVVDARRREGKFTSFADFLGKAGLPALNKRAVESLIKPVRSTPWGIHARGSRPSTRKPSTPSSP